ncbi:hypothetical protein GCM10009720_06440 [Yaniella flava]|uniref:Uncharacterized protein n=1 Tax=Yaniella flava TaxID=287930 RepID=A0ABP5FPS1_9MICC
MDPGSELKGTEGKTLFRGSGVKANDGDEDSQRCSDEGFRSGTGSNECDHQQAQPGKNKHVR